MIRFIVQLYSKKPAAALVLVLLLGLSTGGSVISYLFKEGQKAQKIQLSDKNDEIKQLRSSLKVAEDLNAYKDSAYTANLFHIQQKANDEVHDFLITINQEQKETIKEQEKVKRQQMYIKQNNSTLINKANKVIKTALKDEQK